MFNPNGAFTAIVTPFNDAGNVDFDYLWRVLRRQEQHGMDGVVPCGTNGEGPSLSLAERKEIIEFAVLNKGEMQVIAGTGCASLPETIELASFAEEVGADSALILPPFFFKELEVRGLVNYYRQVLSAAELPVLLYNIPSMTGVEISDELLKGLADMPNLIGVKDTSGSAERTKAHIYEFPGLSILSGSDWLIEKALAEGAKGIISGIGNVFPWMISGIFDAYRAGEDISRRQEEIIKAKDLLAAYPLVPANKAALTFFDFEMTHVRPPLVDLDELETRRLGEAMLSAGIRG